MSRTHDALYRDCPKLCGLVSAFSRQARLRVPGISPCQFLSLSRHLFSRRRRYTFCTGHSINPRCPVSSPGKGTIDLVQRFPPRRRSHDPIFPSTLATKVVITGPGADSQPRRYVSNAIDQITQNEPTSFSRHVVMQRDRDKTSYWV